MHWFQSPLYGLSWLIYLRYEVCGHRRYINIYTYRVAYSIMLFACWLLIILQVLNAMPAHRTYLFENPSDGKTKNYKKKYFIFIGSLQPVWQVEFTLSLKQG